MDGSMDRRKFLKSSVKGLASLGLAGTLGAGAWPALGQQGQQGPVQNDPGRQVSDLNVREPNEFMFSRFKYQGRWDSEWNNNPEADDLLLAFLQKVANVKVSPKTWEERLVSSEDLSKLYTSPFLFMTGIYDIQISDPDAKALGEYLRRGGFIYADDCVYEKDGPSVGDFFFRGFAREAAKFIPGLKMEPVPPSHEIFNCFYDFQGQSPRNKGQKHPDMGLFLDGRMVCFLTPGDVHCGWWNPRWAANQEKCFKFGVNVIMYALTH